MVAAPIMESQMFTIKEVCEGVEYVYTASSVSFHVEPDYCSEDIDAEERSVLAFDGDGIIVSSVSSGSVYVMNDFGIIVAEYHLGDGDITLDIWDDEDDVEEEDDIEEEDVAEEAPKAEVK
jgi:hypothetical protein